MSKKYKIEGGINFFEELYKSLDMSDDYIDDKSDNSLFCLISNEPLTANHVQMKCGHKFNYVPLFNDIHIHKSKFNHLESTNGLLKANQIRCPYCRKKQEELLPYYEEYGLPKVPGVNCHKECSGIPNCWGFQKCEFYVSEGQQSCANTYTSKLEADDKHYCYIHKKVVVKEYKTKAQQKAKEDMKKAKEEAKKAKDEEKLKLKEDKMKLKEELKNAVIKSKSKQVVQEEGDEEKENNIIVCGGCTQEIKSGPKKGKSCNVMIFEDGLCKRHFNLKTKKAVL
jgi:hypothetical protein